MHVDAAAIDAVSDADVRQKAAGKRALKTLTSLDGRTTAARRAAALVATFAIELGGELTSMQRIKVENAAALVAISEDASARRLAGDPDIGLDDLVRTASAARRAIRDLGIKPPTERDYVPLRERWAAEIEDGDEMADEAVDGGAEAAGQPAGEFDGTLPATESEFATAAGSFCGLQDGDDA